MPAVSSFRGVWLPRWNRSPATLKGLLREFGARTRNALDAAVRRAMDLIDRHDAAGWFRHCGYQVG